MIALEQPTPQQSFTSLFELIEWHVQLRPRMQIQDIYKLIYQAILGNEHMAPKISTAQERLKKEIASMDKVESFEFLAEPIHPDGSFFRINLRPFVEAQLDQRMLAEVFCLPMTSSNEPQDFLTQWTELCEDRRLFEILEQSKEGIVAFKSNIKRNAFPVIHHSEIYRQNYKPAYRVVKQSTFQLAFNTRLEVP